MFVLSKNDLLSLYNIDLNELLKISSKYVKDEVSFCSLINARNGKCSQNCRYCAQSSYYKTDVKNHPLVSTEEVYKAALEAKSNHASKFAIVTSGKTPDKSDFDTMLEMIKKINSIDGLGSCASLGILNEEQAKRLAAAGLKRFHHNINTSRSYYPRICTTHFWDERYNTCKLIKKYGMELCCGVILGMGESVEQRVEMALELADIEPDSIPVNILMPIKHTPFENYLDKIDEENILRTLAVLKIANPKSILRLCGGRMRLSGENQVLALKTCVEGMMIGNYLTTAGAEPCQDVLTVEAIGKTIV